MGTNLSFPKTNKYGAVRTAGGFPSKLEASVYQVLCLRIKADDIRDLRRQRTVTLQEGPANQRITWKVDFSFETREGETVYVEAKGFETEAYLLKLKLWRHHGPGPLEIWKSGGPGYPVLVETVIPAA